MYTKERMLKKGPGGVRWSLWAMRKEESKEGEDWLQGSLMKESGSKINGEPNKTKKRTAQETSQINIQKS